MPSNKKTCRSCKALIFCAFIKCPHCQTEQPHKERLLKRMARLHAQTGQAIPFDCLDVRSNPAINQPRTYVLPSAFVDFSKPEVLQEARRRMAAIVDEVRQKFPTPHVSPKKRKPKMITARGKPRGRNGGRRKASATAAAQATQFAEDSQLTAPVELNGNAQEEFERNMERLSIILDSCPAVVPADHQGHSSSSWSSRQMAAQKRWKEARPYHLKCLLLTEAVGQELCCICHQAAVIRCRDCLPQEWLCQDCDILHHKRQPLHNRDSVVDGFLKAIPPSTCFIKVGTGQYAAHEQACILPTVCAPRLCSCEVANVSISPGKEVILITMNGRFDLHLPVHKCSICLKHWTPDVQGLIRSGYWPASTHSQTLYTVDLLSSFQELKVISPGFSRQAFAKLLEHRTQRAGRSGQINGDALQRSFLEYSYASFEKDQLCCVDPFTCPACTPEMMAVSVDGNRKLYRFRKLRSFEDTAFFEGLFLAKDSEVSDFVDTIRSAVKSTQGKATCGSSQWTAARETSRRAAKLDEEGVEVAVCRHGYLLKGLSMYRGEIFAYPLYLQREIHATANVRFLAMDVTCKFWPYLQKVAGALPALQGLLQMKPFLSIMHARAHATKCEIKWSGRNQEGAGTTAGEEVEQVNSFLSRCALTTKYMSKAARVDMLTIHAMEWNKHKGAKLHKALSTRYVKTCQKAVEEEARLSELKEEVHCSDEMALQWVADVQEWAGETTDATDAQHTLQQSIEGLHLSLHQRKQSLYRQNDSNKLRQRLRQGLAKDKKRLLEHINNYNGLVSESQIDVAVVESSLAGQAASHIWPWEMHGNGSSVTICTKKRVHDQQMLTTRLQEEKRILVVEMAQHCASLSNLASVLRTKIIGEEEGNEGLRCVLARRLSEVEGRLKLVLQQYRLALGPDASLLGDVCEESEGDESEPEVSDDDEDAEEEET